MKTRIRQQLLTLGRTLRGKQLHPLRRSIRITAGLLVLLDLASAGASSGRLAEPDPTIRVRVTNYTEATPATVSKAEREAGRLLDEAGLNAVWIDCPVGQSAVIASDPCQQPLAPTDIVLRVLPDRARNGVQDSAFGIAVLPVLASVYYEHAASLARADGGEFETPIILGFVMAHEIGHLMLGSNSHSDTGIMQGQWERKQVRQIMRGDLHFTAQQSKLIRAEGQTRMNHESAQLRASSSRG